MNRTARTNERCSRAGGSSGSSGGGRFRSPRHSGADRSEAAGRSAGSRWRPAPQGEFALPVTVTPVLPAATAFADLDMPAPPLSALGAKGVVVPFPIRAETFGTVVTLVLPGRRREMTRLTADAGIPPWTTQVHSGEAELSRITGAQAVGRSRHPHRTGGRACPAQRLLVTRPAQPSRSGPAVSRHAMNGARRLRSADLPQPGRLRDRATPVQAAHPCGQGSPVNL